MPIINLNMGDERKEIATVYLTDEGGLGYENHVVGQEDLGIVASMMLERAFEGKETREVSDMLERLTDPNSLERDEVKRNFYTGLRFLVAQSPLYYLVLSSVPGLAQTVGCQVWARYKSK